MNFKTIVFRTKNASEHSSVGVHGPTVSLLRSELERNPQWEPGIEDVPMYLQQVWRVEQRNGKSYDEPEVLYQGSSEEEARAIYARNDVGRPRVYGGRVKTTIELPSELIEAIDALRGEKKRMLFLEEVLRQVPEIAQELESQRVSEFR